MNANETNNQRGSDAIIFHTPTTNNGGGWGNGGTASSDNARRVQRYKKGIAFAGSVPRGRAS